jgi:quercetin dioxygenase-like cupin family protein
MIQDQTYPLGPGDSLLFESHLPHRWKNSAAEPSKALLVFCPSDMRDRPTEHHFASTELFT